MAKPISPHEPTTSSPGERPTDEIAPQQEYEIGYGKAPIRSRFQKGVSGNPKGRPKGARNFKTDVKETLEARVRMKGENPQTLSTQKAMLLRLREKALHGDPRALDRLLALAQTYNDEEVVAAGNMPAEDVRLLELYQHRLLSGAAECFGGKSSETNDAPDAAQSENDEETVHE